MASLKFKEGVKAFSRELPTIILAVAVSAFAITMFYIADPISVTQNYTLDGRVGVINDGINNDALSYLQKVKLLGADTEVQNYLQNGDGGSLAAVINAKLPGIGLPAAIATDKNGLALYRTIVSGQTGDYILQRSPWGRSIAAGKDVAGVEVGDPLPLIVLAGSPVIKDGKMIGALFGGGPMDDVYAKNIKARYLGANEEIAFFSADKKIVGKSFENQQWGELLAAYINHGYDTPLAQTGGAPNLAKYDIEIEGRQFWVKEINFPPNGGDKSPGGALVFYFQSHSDQASLYALASLLLFVILAYLILLVFRKNRKNDGGTDWIAFFITCLAVFLVVYIITIYSLDNRTLKIKHPPYTIYNSTLNLIPETGTWDKTFEHRLKINISSGGEAVNAAKVYLSYDPKIVKLADIDTTNSICPDNLFLEKTIDNNMGRAGLVCIIPNPGFSGDSGTIAELIFEPINYGSFSLNFQPNTQILANDGLGTNVLRISTDGSYNVLPPAGNVSQDQLLIFSPTHPNSARWYNTRRAAFTWLNPQKNKYLYWLDQQKNSSAPDNAIHTDASDAEVRAGKDGIYYFHLTNEKNKPNIPSVYKIMIDTTPPLLPDIKLSNTVINKGEVVHIDFSSQDNASGLQKSYYVKLANGLFLPVLPPLFFAFPDTGMHTVHIRAMDRAGNFSDASAIVEVR